MKCLIDELEEFTKDENLDYALYHKDRLGDDANINLTKFLYSTMDQARLENSEKYSKAILKITNAAPMIYFRKAVLRKELYSDIDYNLQRDHSAHTLHNYLLGWYIYSNSTVVKTAFKNFFNKILKKFDNTTLSESNILNYFGDIWPLASLAHDLGYLLEGGLEATSTDSQSKKVQRGAIILEDYFSHKIWGDMNLRSIDERNYLMKPLKVEIPEFQTKTIAGVANCLMNIGDTNLLRQRAKEELLKRKVHSSSALEPNVSASDAFSLWESFYSGYNCRKMKRRITNLRHAYEAYLWEGHPESGIRLIDHGVSSGLIILMADTFFHRFYTEAINNGKKDKDYKRKFDDYTEGLFPESHGSFAHLWWAYSVWGSAAAALHNIQQEERPWPGCNNDTGKLSINEDPLAYLGILVDILEEWDRYSVMRRRYFTKYSAIQSKDVSIELKDNIVNINFGDEKRAKKIKKALYNALTSWNKIINIVV